MKKQGNEVTMDPLPGSLNFMEVIAKILDGDFLEAALDELAASERPE
jgi:hypothetical protein